MSGWFMASRVALAELAFKLKTIPSFDFLKKVKIKADKVFVMQKKCIYFFSFNKIAWRWFVDYLNENQWTEKAKLAEVSRKRQKL